MIQIALAIFHQLPPEHNPIYTPKESGVVDA